MRLLQSFQITLVVILYQLRFIFSYVFRKHAREIYHLIHEACPHLCLLWHHLPPWGCSYFGHDIWSKRTQG